MKRIVAIFTMTLLMFCSFNSASGQFDSSPLPVAKEEATVVVPLPPPAVSGDLSVEEAINQRRSVRTYSDNPLKAHEIGQLVWAAQGITSSGGLRSAPSAGATYPLEIYVIAGIVEAIPAGIYRYLPQKHSLELIHSGDVREELSKAALGQPWVRDAPASLIISGLVDRTAVRYGNRAERYMLMEAGHAAENVFLQALSCHLGSVMIGAFMDEELKDLVEMGKSEQPLAIIPVGR